MDGEKLADWLPRDPALQPFYDGVQLFVKSHIGLPLAAQAKDKSILDPIVGYVHLNPWEVSLIDTRLFQRLKSIHQLGLASQAFPSLGYSRFEHTLGVIGRLAEVLNTLAHRHRGSEIELVIRENEDALRLAALFHDVGHCLFSHVSERVISTLEGYAGYPSAATIRNAFARHFHPGPHPSMAEVFSLTILGTQYVFDFVEGLDIPSRERPLNERIRCAARFILGLPVERDPRTMFLAQIMNSGFDIDKLDYMTREAHYSAIELGIDRRRLMDKLRVFKIGASELPRGLESYKRLFKPAVEPYVLGFARGGQFAFEEFCLARVSLYDKIYLHQKVRGAEGQLVSRLKGIPRAFPQYGEAHRWLHLRESHLEHPDARVPTIADPGPLFPEEIKTFQGLGLIDIVDRNLVHRAFAFGPANSLSEPPVGARLALGTVPSPGTTLVEHVRDRQENFLESIAAEAKRICTLLEIEPPPENLRDLLVVDVPTPSRVQQGIDTVYFERPARLSPRWAMPIDRIVEYYLKNRALAFVFAPRDYCPLVLVAAERVAWDMSEAVFVQEDVVSDSVVERAETLRKRLNGAGYYLSTPSLKPPSEYLLSAEAQELIAKVCNQLVDFVSFTGQRVTQAHVMTFLDQFPDEALQEAGLRLLEHMRMVDASQLARVLVEVLSSPPVSDAGQVALVS